MEFAVSDIHYFKKLQERLGHNHKDDPKKLPLKKLVALGKALNEEYGLISGGQSNEVHKQRILDRIEERQDDTRDNALLVLTAKDYWEHVDRIGHHLTMGDAPATPKQRWQLRDEMWWVQQQLVEIANKYHGDLRELWLDYADQVARSAHYYENNDGAVAVWLRNLRTEFKRRDVDMEG